MEWLLMDHSVYEARQLLKKGVARAFVRLTDVSDVFTSFSICGTQTRSVLIGEEDGSHVLAAPEPGEYVMTRLGRIEVILHCTGPYTFEVHVAKSLAPSFESWLATQQLTQPREAPSKH
jgi:sarcosine oxidase gamma subunit